jgi:bifunctional polynucleotide phosphatase/kinase
MSRKFAHNVGLKFYTPEETFLGEAPISVFSWDGIVPTEVLAKLKPATWPATHFIKPAQEMIIMVGMPASGKSTFTLKYFAANGYVRVNQDMLGTEAKCKKAAQEALSQGKSVVIDNTNAGKAKRSVFIGLCGNVSRSSVHSIFSPPEI